MQTTGTRAVERDAAVAASQALTETSAATPQPVFGSNEEAAGVVETRSEWLGRAGSDYAKVRHLLVQQPRTPGSRTGSTPGTLSKFARNHRALILYLALLTNWPWMSDATPALAAAWLRFLNSAERNRLVWTEQSLSHAWKVLESFNLVERPRSGRLRAVRPRREDGAVDYAAPTGRENDRYFILPHSFWSEEWHARLNWPGLSVLLVLLKETGARDSAELTIDRAQNFYGIGRTTAEAGLVELRNSGLLVSRDRFIRDVDSSTGRRLASEHALLGPFATAARTEQQAKAQERVRATRSRAARSSEKGARDEQQAADL